MGGKGTEIIKKIKIPDYPLLHFAPRISERFLRCLPEL